MASAERPTSNVQHKYDADDPVCEEAMVGYQLIALLVIALRVSPASRVRPVANRIVGLTRQKMLQFFTCHVCPDYCILCVHTDSHAITCCSPVFAGSWRRCSPVCPTYSEPQPSLTAMIQLKPGIPPASLNKPSRSAAHRKNRTESKKNGGLRFKRVFSNSAVAPFDQIE